MPHEFGWKTIPKADYDAFVRGMSEYVMLQDEINRALGILRQKVWTVDDIKRVRDLIQQIRNRWLEKPDSEREPTSPTTGLQLVPPLPEFRS